MCIIYSTSCKLLLAVREKGQHISLVINSDNFPIGFPNGVDLHEEWIGRDGRYKRVIPIDSLCPGRVLALT